MNRRSFIGGIIGSLSAPSIVQTASGQPIDGVGVLRFPENVSPELRSLAQDIAGSIRKGTILALPNKRDWKDDYEWDFRIEGGDPGQVKIERK